MDKKIKVLVNTSTFQENVDDKVTDVINNLVNSLKEVNEYLEFYILKPMGTSGNKILENENYKIFTYRYIFPKNLQTFHERGIVPAIKENKLNIIKLIFLFISQFISLLKLSYKVRPDYIYAHWVLPQALVSALVCKILKIKLLFTTHGAEVLLLNKIKIVNKILLNFITKNTYKFTSNSSLTMSQITDNTKNKFFINKNKIIPMGIRDEFFNLSIENKEYNKNKFLYIGRLVDYKGVEILIESMKSLQDKNCNFNLDILGSGVDEDLLKEKVKSYDLSEKVVFQGFKNLSQKIEYYRNADVTFIPSIISKDRLEGGPLTVIEAMSQKSICIVSDSIGFINYLNDKNCIIFKSGNVESLSRAINKYLEMSYNEKTLMSREAYKTAMFFKFENIAKIHNQFLFS